VKTSLEKVREHPGLRPADELLTKAAIGPSAFVLRTRALESLIPDSSNPIYDRTRQLIGEMVSEIESRYPEPERARIYEALQLALRLHGPQGVRLDNQPFVNHVMDVPLNLMRKLGIRNADSAIAAILHDIVEDQAAALVILENPERILPNSLGKLRDLALQAIERRFGRNARTLVDKLTNRDYDRMALKLKAKGGRYACMSVQKIKHRLYQKHVIKLGEARDSCSQDAFAIKIADFMDNALRHGDLPTATAEQRAAKDKLADKRGLLFVYFERVLLPRLPERHPLSRVKGKLISMFGGCYDQAYIEVS
jgi:hypothetical protein